MKLILILIIKRNLFQKFTEDRNIGFANNKDKRIHIEYEFFFHI